MRNLHFFTPVWMSLKWKTIPLGAWYNESGLGLKCCQHDEHEGLDHHKDQMTEKELSIIKPKFLGSWGTWCQDGSNGWPAPVGVPGHEQAHRWPDEQPQPGERHEHVEANHPGHQPPVHFWVSSFHRSYSWNRNSPGNRLGKFLNHHRFSLDLIFSGR